MQVIFLKDYIVDLNTNRDEIFRGNGEKIAIV